MALGDTLWEILKSSASTILEAAAKIAERFVPIEKQIGDLIQAYESESLTLVLGAGVSVEYGLPDWNTLLQSLLLSATIDSEEPFVASLFTQVFNPSPLVAARFVRNHYHNKVADKSFEDVTREIIYQQIKADIHSPLMKEICALVLAPARSPMLDSIITYNFDDILEREVRRLSFEIGIDIPIRTIAGPEARPSARELPIYHVHGYLSSDPHEPIAHPVTLGEADYHQQYNEVYRWENMVQINKFADAHCLFLGTSFSDPNLRRLLDIAHAQHGEKGIRHYVVRKIPPLDQVKSRLGSILNDQVVQAATTISNNKQDELASSLLALHMKFEQDDAASFGVGILWVNDYPDIPRLLQAIRLKDTSLVSDIFVVRALLPAITSANTKKTAAKTP